MSGDCGKHKIITYEFIVIQIFLPFIERFLKGIVDKSKEILHVEITSIGHQLIYGKGIRSDTPVTLYIDNPIHFCWLMILDRKIGLGEAYMAGDWRAEPNPTEFLKLLIRAKKANCSENKVQKLDADKMIGSTLNLLLRSVRWITAVVAYIQHRFRDNTISQSVKNIQEHYDLGNDMFTMFLDKTMTYSCALFKDPAMTVKCVDLKVLEEAQLTKIDTLIDMLDINQYDRVLEIGCGWGALAIRAVQRSGCSWTGLTISHEQLEFGKKRVKAAGLQNKIDLRYQDYRMAEETYTRVISVEMIEAVGHDFLPEYFRIISDRLKPGGKAVIQAITCPDSCYEGYRSSSDFIKKYIFPGGHMPSIGAINSSLTDDLRWGEKRHIGRHYATTLDHWHSAWMLREKDILSLGYSASFHRRWQFYFCLCSALFANDHIDTIQFQLIKR